MKKTLLLVIILFSTLILKSQDENYSPFVKKNFPKTHAVITSEASKEWPGDYEMQAYKIKGQCNSFYEYLYISSPSSKIPENILDEIKSKAIVEWGKNPDFGTKCDSFVGVPKLDCAYSYINADWDMVMYVVKNQIEAYKSLNK